MDMQTPGLSGLLIISAIRELEPKLPIPAVSSTPQEDAGALSSKGVSFSTLPSGGQRDGQALMTTLARTGGTCGVSSGAGLR